MENRLHLILLALMVYAAPAIAEQFLGDDDLVYVLAGREVKGHYANGAAFSETFHRDGTITYADEKTKTKGTWSISQAKICTSYDQAPGGCFQLVRHSENCFEFWLEGTDPKTGSWLARASQSKYADTCPQP
jgi:hypothetical protein